MTNTWLKNKMEIKNGEPPQCEKETTKREKIITIRYMETNRAIRKSPWEDRRKKLQEEEHESYYKKLTKNNNWTRIKSKLKLNKRLTAWRNELNEKCEEQ